MPPLPVRQGQVPGTERIRAEPSRRPSKSLPVFGEGGRAKPPAASEVGWGSCLIHSAPYRSLESNLPNVGITDFTLPIVRTRCYGGLAMYANVNLFIDGAWKPAV